MKSSRRDDITLIAMPHPLSVALLSYPRRKLDLQCLSGRHGFAILDVPPGKNLYQKKNPKKAAETWFCHSPVKCQPKIRKYGSVLPTSSLMASKRVP
ncbi:hypothetical protein [Methanosarcina sp. 2.H.T.1A.15]|uniref:hypothetical protein n=1 Tax=Methanosarcina sp. 2.H.T.1A.15 TaxID=1483596 RepID=UPI0012DFFEC9|nr:hypothetical protein [Methanosarcina sp. 2.H.T.1A.15]